MLIFPLSRYKQTQVSVCVNFARRSWKWWEINHHATSSPQQTSTMKMTHKSRPTRSIFIGKISQPQQLRAQMWHSLSLWQLKLFRILPQHSTLCRKVVKRPNDGCNGFISSLTLSLVLCCALSCCCTFTTLPRWKLCHTKCQDLLVVL